MQYCSGCKLFLIEFSRGSFNVFFVLLFLLNACVAPKTKLKNIFGPITYAIESAEELPRVTLFGTTAVGAKAEADAKKRLAIAAVENFMFALVPIKKEIMSYQCGS